MPMTEPIVTETLTHSPGPWREAGPEFGAHGVRYVFDASPSWPHEVAVLYGSNNEHQAADARLIAAAPDLLAALKALVFVARVVSEVHGASSDCDQMERARAAIAKAEGTK